MRRRTSCCEGRAFLGVRSGWRRYLVAVAVAAARPFERCTQCTKPCGICLRLGARCARIHLPCSPPTFPEPRSPIPVTVLALSLYPSVRKIARYVGTYVRCRICGSTARLPPSPRYARLQRELEPWSNRRKA